MKNQKTLSFALTCAVLLAVETTMAQDKKPGLNLDLMDKSVKPGDDFFRYVNGTWFDKTDIPADRTRWGSFDELRQNTDKDALAILKEAVANKKLDPKSDQAKAVNVYKTYMDTIARNKRGIEPIKKTLLKIENLKNSTDVNNLLIERQSLGGLGFYGMSVGVDAKNSNRNVLNIGPGSLGLPDRDYYVAEDPDSKEKRAKYVDHVARMFQYLGLSESKANEDAARVLAFETAMAQPRMDRVERRDRRKSYNPMTIAQLQDLTPSVNWKNYIAAAGIKSIDTVIVVFSRLQLRLPIM
jgi:putative endopeptidase